MGLDEEEKDEEGGMGKGDGLLAVVAMAGDHWVAATMSVAAAINRLATDRPRLRLFPG